MSRGLDALITPALLLYYLLVPKYQQVRRVVVQEIQRQVGHLLAPRIAGMRVIAGNHVVLKPHELIALAGLDAVGP